MRPSGKAIALLVPSLFVLTSCATTEKYASKSKEFLRNSATFVKDSSVSLAKASVAEYQYIQALTEYEEGRPYEAFSLLEKFVKQYPKHSRGRKKLDQIGEELYNKHIRMADKSIPLRKKILQYERVLSFFPQDPKDIRSKLMHSRQTLENTLTRINTFKDHLKSYRFIEADRVLSPITLASAELKELAQARVLLKNSVPAIRHLASEQFSNHNLPLSLSLYKLANRLKPGYRPILNSIRKVQDEIASPYLDLAEQYSSVSMNPRLSLALHFLKQAAEISPSNNTIRKTMEDISNRRDNRDKPRVVVIYRGFTSMDLSKITDVFETGSLAGYDVRLAKAKDIRSLKRSNELFLHLSLLDFDHDVRRQPFKLKWGEYLAGQRTIPNPAYNNLLLAYQNAMNRYNQANINTIYSYGWAKLGNSIAQAIIASQVRGVRDQLQNTPQYLQEPVYANYKYQERKVTFSTSMKFQYEIWDLWTMKRLKKGILPFGSTLTLIERKGAHPEDRHSIKDNQVDDIDQQAFLGGAIREAGRKVKEVVHSSYLSRYAFRFKQARTMGLMDQAFEHLLTYRDLFSTYGTLANPYKAAEFKDLKKAISNWGFRLTSDERLMVARNVTVQPEEQSLRVAKPPVVQHKLAKVANVERLTRLIRRVRGSVVRVKAGSSSGSGTLLIGGRYVITNAHVVGKRDAVVIVFGNGDRARAEVIAKSSRQDLALLELPEPVSGGLDFANESEIEIGQTVIAIGSAFGLDQTVTRGIISGVRKLRNMTVIQTDAAINSGNSGGPLLNADGKVVGINSFTIRKDLAEGLNFSIGPSHVRKFLRRNLGKNWKN